MKKVTTNYAEKTGRIGAQHCMNGYPGRALRAYNGKGFTANQFDAACDWHEAQRTKEIFSEIASPIVRLADSKNTGYAKQLEVPFIFRDFRKDPDDPANYYFPSTDVLVAGALEECPKSALMYRLGAPWEFWAPRFNKKPDDYDKFAKVCVNIISHYNDGWGDGFHYGIPYFEIWERADDPMNWSNGSWEDYYRLYDTIARKIKEYDPDLLVGGPAAADISDRPGFLKGFVDFVCENNSPCDFISWHHYSEDPDNAYDEAVTVRRTVGNSALAGKVKIFCDAWNCMTLDEDGRYRVPNVRNMQGAAFGEAFMLSMQKAGMDASAYFMCGRNLPYTGLFHVRPLTPEKPLYAIEAFSWLFSGENAVSCTVEGENVYACASSGNGKRVTLAAVYSDGEDEVSFDLGSDGVGKTVYLLDEGHDLEPVFETEETEFTLKTHGYTVIAICSEDTNDRIRY